MMAFTCLIPAHNEAARIAEVLRAVIGHPNLARVLVVDDGSKDGTADLARLLGAEVLRLEMNGGKSAALAKGLALVETSHVVLIDADLRGLTAGDISALLHPVMVGKAKLSLSLRGNAPLLWRAIGVDYITGERVLPMALLRGHEARIAALPRFGFEVFLNDLILSRGLRISVVSWAKVSSPLKSAKAGLVRGLWGDVKMIRDILNTVGIESVVQQIIGLRRLADVSAFDRVKPPLAKLKSAVQRGMAR